MRFHVNRADAVSRKLHKPSNFNRGGAHGFTLIEVLVAIVILTLGASGVAAMQLRALRMTQQSGFQTAATQLAVTLAERMRANAEQARSGNSAYLFSYQAGATSSTAATGCMHHACNGATMAMADVLDWQRQLRQALPQARAVVCRDSNPAAANKLQWSCDHAGDAAIVIKIGWSARDNSTAGKTSAMTESAPRIAIATAL